MRGKREDDKEKRKRELDLEIGTCKLFPQKTKNQCERGCKDTSNELNKYHFMKHYRQLLSINEKMIEKTTYCYRV